MKFNWKKFFLINFCILAVILIIAEFTAYWSYREKYLPFVIQQSKLLVDPEDFVKKYKPQYIIPKKFNYNEIKEILLERVYYSKNNKKRPVITIGCSYTDGATLEAQQTFAYKLNELTDRTTYNRGFSGTGSQFVYKQLSDENLKNEIPDAEFVIYTFIHHHLLRNVRDLIEPYTSVIDLSYKIKNGKLVEKNRPFWLLYSSFLTKTFLEYKNQRDFNDELNNGLPFFMKIMEESVNEINKKYPNCKFVLLEFPQGDMCLSGY